MAQSRFCSTFLYDGKDENENNNDEKDGTGQENIVGMVEMQSRDGGMRERELGNRLGKTKLPHHSSDSVTDEKGRNELNF